MADNKLYYSLLIEAIHEYLYHIKDCGLRHSLTRLYRLKSYYLIRYLIKYYIHIIINFIKFPIEPLDICDM